MHKSVLQAHNFVYEPVFLIYAPVFLGYAPNGVQQPYHTARYTKTKNTRSLGFVCLIHSLISWDGLFDIESRHHVRRRLSDWLGFNQFGLDDNSLGQSRITSNHRDPSVFGWFD